MQIGPMLGVLSDGELIEIIQCTEFDPSAGRWAYSDVLPDGSPIETKTFLPFLWGYGTWELALEAFRNGTITNINHMTRSWK